MCFRLIDAEKAQHHVSRLCEVLGVSRAGYYAWTRRPVSAHDQRDRELTRLVKRIHGKSRGSYGWPRMHAELRHRGVAQQIILGKALRRRIMPDSPA